MYRSFSEKKQIIHCLLIILAAMILRILFVEFYPASPLAGADQKAFWSFGMGISSGDGFRSDFEPWLADRPPLYSYMLAGIFQLLGESQRAVV